MSTTREKLPGTRNGVTQHFTIISRSRRSDDADGVQETEGYIQTGEYEDGRLGEIFLKVGKAGSSEAWHDEWAKCASIAFQHGVPVDVLLDKHVNTRFEPSGAVKGVAGIARCTSPLDLICRWLVAKYGTKTYSEAA